MIDWYARLNSIADSTKKVDIARSLGISRQRLNYYFRTKSVPKSFLTKSIKSKITRLWRKDTYSKRANGYRKIYKKFRFNKTSMFRKIKRYALALSGRPKDKLIQGQFIFESSNGTIYAPATDVYNIVAGGFELFKQDVLEIYGKYKIVPKKDLRIGDSSTVSFDGFLIVRFFY